MPEITILTERELADCIVLDADAIACIEACFRTLATEAVVMPPILRLDIPEHHGEVDVKTAYLPGVPGFAIKISPGFFDNPKLGLPSVNGLMLLFSATTGLVEAVLLDNGYLTDVRTAAAGAVAAKWLARQEAATAGDHRRRRAGRLQLEALRLVRADRARAGLGARRGKARAFAETAGAELGLDDRRGAEPGGPAPAERYRGHHHAEHDAADPGRLAAARPARHRDGLGCRAQERAGAGRDHKGRPLCAIARASARCSASCIMRSWPARCRPTPALPSSARWSPARTPAAHPIGRSPSVI